MWRIKIVSSLDTKFSSLDKSWYFIGVYIITQNNKSAETFNHITKKKKHLNLGKVVKFHRLISSMSVVFLDFSFFETFEDITSFRIESRSRNMAGKVILPSYKQQKWSN